MPTLAYTPEDEQDPVAFWDKVRTNTAYSPAQRDWASDAWRAESQWTGNDPSSLDRRGTMFRGIDQFNQAGAPVSTTPGAGTGSAATQPPAANTTTQQTQQTLNDTLIRLMTQNTANVSAADPNLQPAAGAYRLARERARTGEQQDLAERLGARGLSSSGAMDTGINQTWDRAGEDIAGFEANLVLNELNTRRQEILKAMALAGDMIGTDQRLALQKQLADIDAAIRRESLGTQRDLGFADINTRMLLGLLANQQFNDQLGFNIGDREAYWNYMGLGSLL